MKILFVAKPTSDNFIRNYTDNMPDAFLLVTLNPEKVVQRAKKFDCIVFEWANDFTAQCVNNFDFAKPVFVRVHDHEVRHGRIHNINWRQVTAAWFINNDIKALFSAQYPSVKTFFLPNAVDPSPFTIGTDKHKKIGLLSIYCRPRKRIDRAIELARLLPDFELVIRTDPNDGTGDNSYFRSLKKQSNDVPNVVWDLRPAANFIHTGYGKADVNEFFQDKMFVVSTSEHEGFHYTIAEGALCGAIPVVYNWEFGRATDFWKPFVCDSVKEMAQFIKEHEHTEACPASYVHSCFSPLKLRKDLQEHLKKAMYEATVRVS